MTTTFEKDTLLCPHCGAEPIDDDELCRFCGNIIVTSGGKEKTGRRSLAAGFRALKVKIRPMNAEELDETLISADYSNPANPIWDD
jgi:hypothetical protein